MRKTKNGPDDRGAAAAAPQPADGFESTDFGRRRLRWLPGGLRSLGRIIAKPLRFLYHPEHDTDRMKASPGTRGGPPAGGKHPGA
jgi:hypothetical protein